MGQDTSDTRHFPRGRASIPPMTEPDPAATARELIAREGTAVLSTLSRRLRGWPFGSLAPYTLGASGEPLLLMSEIAEHTRNVRADARASLFISDSSAAADPQASARVTLVGFALPVPEFEQEEARRRYLTRFPASADYFRAHDFTLFTMRLEQVRFIGGFGQIHWLEPAAVVMRADPLARSAPTICAHMNRDHADALLLYCRSFAGVEASTARMIALDARGFEVVAETPDGLRPLRFDFPHSVATPEEVRRVMIELVAEARRRSSQTANPAKNSP